MKAYKDFIISPIGGRYNNSIKVDNKELILNTEVYNHQYVNRLAKVIATPLLFSSPINVGDEVIIHHNVFRRWHDVKGKERNSRSYWKDNKYLISEDQIYLYKNSNKIDYLYKLINSETIHGIQFLDIDKIKDIFVASYLLKFNALAPVIAIPDLLTPGTNDKI